MCSDYGLLKFEHSQISRGVIQGCQTGSKNAATTLTDAQQEIIAPHCLGRESDPGRTGPDLRLFVEAVLWIARSGCPWRDLPDALGKWNTVFKQLRRWVKGVQAA